MWRTLPILLIGFHLCAQPDFILKSVEPDYGKDADALPYKEEIVAVKVRAFPDGTPYALESSKAKLPDPVVVALARMRFRPASKDSENMIVALRVPVRRYAKDVALPNQPIPPGLIRGHLLRSVPPVYPQRAKEVRLQGLVTLRVVIGKTGQVTDLLAVDGPPERFESAAIAVRQWLYRPYEVDGQPVEVYANIEVNYKLN